MIAHRKGFYIMKINWTVRLKNKTWLLAMVTAVLAFTYQLLGLLGIVPAVSQEQITQLVGLAINILVALGIVIDPTTDGLGDSERAMSYGKEKKTPQD